MSKLRLLKVIVQPIFVLDDGDALTEQTADPVVIPGNAWRSFADPGGAFDVAIADLARRAEAPTGDDA